MERFTHSHVEEPNWKEAQFIDDDGALTLDFLGPSDYTSFNLLSMHDPR